MTICGRHEAAALRDGSATHLLSIANPGARIERPRWFEGKHLCLFFGDVVSPADAAQFGTTAPCLDHVARAVEFSRAAWHMPNGKLIIHCEYGASRSPGLAYVLIADRLGPGLEEEALRRMFELRPNALPNKLVVDVGDKFLVRGGELLKPLRAFYARINRELDGCLLDQFR